MSNRIVEAQSGAHSLDEDEELVNVFEEDNEFEDDTKQPDTEADAEAKAEVKDEYQVPEKFKGKTVADIVKSYEHLEREYGRKNNEVGELRKLTDKLLQLEPSSKPQEKAEDETIDADALLENPAEVIRKTLAKDPTIQTLVTDAVERKRREQLSVFESQHPDWQSVMASKEFVEWVGKSPMRVKELVRANNEYDYDTGSDLLNQFKEVHSGKSADNEAEEQHSDTREEDFKKISGEKRSSQSAKRKRIYDREQLIELRLNNPDAYDKLWAQDLEQAYAEGRVRSRRR